MNFLKKCRDNNLKDMMSSERSIIDIGNGVSFLPRKKFVSEANTLMGKGYKLGRGNLRELVEEIGNEEDAERLFFIRKLIEFCVNYDCKTFHFFYKPGDDCAKHGWYLTPIPH